MDLAWCIADPHFSAHDLALGGFRRFLGAFLDSETPTLILLGDLFPVWVALPGVQDPHQRDVADALVGLRARGRSVSYLVGNRDYFLETLAPAPFDSLSERWDLATPAGLVRFEHGDLINTADRNYRRWRAFSRSRAVLALFRALPPTLQSRLAAKLERALDPTNRAYKACAPGVQLEGWARDLARGGYSGAVVGHFHRDQELVVHGLKVKFMPQFREDGAHLRIRADGSWALERMAAVAGSR
jgi:UDP-2,3-diacylglucosamine pyrophosphatase LpxH